MARKRRKKGEKPRKQEAEKSKNFILLLGVIGLVLLVVFFALRSM